MRTPRSACVHRLRAGLGLRVETLESRNLLSSSGLNLPAPLLEAEPNDTLDQAQVLGTLTGSGQVALDGTIGNAPTGAADVDWYSFTLSGPATVSLALAPRGGDSLAAGVLGLYNNDPFDFADPSDPLGHRLLAQSAGSLSGSDVRMEQLLGSGTYYVAISGGGNRSFHPFLAGSGYPGLTGSYELSITTADAGLDSSGGPVVLSADPAPRAVLTSSPSTLRLDLSGALDTNTISYDPTLPGQTVRLTSNPNGTFGDGNDQVVPLTSVNFSSAVNELQLFPAAPLAPGSYQVFLAGDSSTGQAVLADPNGTPFGATATHPLGQDYTLTFQVAGVEGNSAATGADDAPTGSHDLGDVSGVGLVQATGTIGDDPAYNPANVDPSLANPAADVDLYHFHIADPGQHALVAEVFAGRIGSPLDPALSLFTRDPGTGLLTLVKVNDNTTNDSVASNGSLPLFTDPVLFAGLGPGDYYLAVSSTGNVPDSTQGLLPGTNGIFDPNVTHSGQGGYSTGAYVLNLLVQADNTPPAVLSVTPGEGAGLDAPPTQLTVQFSEPVNVQELAYQAYQQTSESQVAAVYVLGADGVTYSPRLVSYDQATNQAVFLMLDPLPNGVNVLHLSGPGGLTDMAGNPLPSNDPSGDYVVPFTVQGPTRGTPGNPLSWNDQEPAGPDQAQDLGTLFPHDLQTGVTITRNFTQTPATAPADQSDSYRFQVLQSRPYFFRLHGSGLPNTVGLTLRDAAGREVTLTPQAGGAFYLTNLDPGTYTLQVGTWSPDQAATVAYQVSIQLGGSVEDPTPLTDGPAPALRLRLASNTPTSSPGAGLPATPSGTQLRLNLPVSSDPGTHSTVIPAQLTTSPQQTLTGLPPGALAPLHTDTLGGVKSVLPDHLPTVTERLVLQNPTSSLTTGQVQLAVLDTSGSATDAAFSGSEAGPVTLVGEALQTLERVGEALVSFLQSPTSQPVEAASNGSVVGSPGLAGFVRDSLRTLERLGAEALANFFILYPRLTIFEGTLFGNPGKSSPPQQTHSGEIPGAKLSRDPAAPSWLGVGGGLVLQASLLGSWYRAAQRKRRQKGKAS